MSTKTIAVETGVYQRLSREKRDSESFTKVIDRLLKTSARAHTGSDIAKVLSTYPPLSDQDATVMHSIVRENRDSETWESS